MLCQRCSPTPTPAASTFKRRARRTSRGFRASALWWTATPCPCAGFFSITARFHQSLSRRRCVSAEKSANQGRTWAAEVLLGIISHARAPPWPAKLLLRLQETSASFALRAALPPQLIELHWYRNSRVVPCGRPSRKLFRTGNELTA